MIQLLNDPEDLQWLRDVHLKGLPEADLPFLSYLIEGNEDAPDNVTLYATVEPTIDEAPLAVLTSGQFAWEL